MVGKRPSAGGLGCFTSAKGIVCAFFQWFPGTTDLWQLERVDISIKQLKLNEHDLLPAERRKVWQKMTRAIDVFLDAKAKYRPGINPAPKRDMELTAKQIREMTREDAELSSVALWCLRFRNNPQLLRLSS